MDEVSPFRFCLYFPDECSDQDLLGIYGQQIRIVEGVFPLYGKKTQGLCEGHQVLCSRIEGTSLLCWSRTACVTFLLSPLSVVYISDYFRLCHILGKPHRIHLDSNGRMASGRNVPSDNSALSSSHYVRDIDFCSRSYLCHMVYGSE